MNSKKTNLAQQSKQNLTNMVYTRDKQESNVIVSPIEEIQIYNRMRINKNQD